MQLSFLNLSLLSILLFAFQTFSLKKVLKSLGWQHFLFVSMLFTLTNGGYSNLLHLRIVVHAQLKLTHRQIVGCKEIACVF